MRASKKYFTKQHDSSDCGCACLSMITKFHGGYEPISRIRLKSGTSKEGTNLLGLYKASKEIGFNPKAYECEFKNLKTLKYPLIAHVVKKNLEHFIVIFGYNLKTDNFIIADPATKIEKISSIELAEIYKTGHILVLEPNENFNKKNIKSSKYSFFKSLVKPDKSIIITNIIIGIIVSVLGLSLSIIIQKIIDVYLPSKDFSKIILIISILSLILLFRLLFGTYRRFLSIKQTNAFNIRLVNAFYSKLLKLSLPFFESKSIGDLTARLEDTQRINKLIIFILEKFILNILIIIVSLSIIFYYSKDLFLLSIISIPLFILGIIFWGILKVINETLNIGEFFAVFSIANLLMPVVQECISIISPLNEAKVAFDRMFEYSFSETEDVNLGITFNEEIKSIEIINLSYAYPDQISFLDNVNILLRAGEINGIIGETGSGKTTLRKIFEKFYQYNEGDIIINDKVSLNNISINNWRSMLGVVHQDIHLFNGTILQNISMSKFNDDYVIEFCKKNGFNEYFENFSNSYNTLIGENGIMLSGGQKQLISIARCLINNYQIIIFDEATSAIDRKTENFIIDLLKKLKEKKRILFITHKLNILPRIADKIYLIEDGTISFGSHKELIEKSNFYSEYFKENFLS